MNDTTFVITTFLRHLAGYPLAVVQDFIWFKLNHRPNWLRKNKKKYFDRLDADKVRLHHVTDRFRFWLKSKERKS